MIYGNTCYRTWQIFWKQYSISKKQFFAFLNEYDRLSLLPVAGE